MIYTRYSIDILKSIIDPKDILVDVGGVSYKDISDNGSELRCRCPLHDGDQKTAFSWKKANGIWSCFTKKCGEDQNIIRDVFGFVCLRLNINFLEAVELLARKYNFSLDLAETSRPTLSKSSGRSKFKIENMRLLRSLPGYCNSREAHDNIIEYLKLRKYTDLGLIKEFNLYPCLDCNNYLRLGIPAHDDFGNLVGVNARRLDGILKYPPTEPKYRMVRGFKKGNVLFNLHQAKNQACSKGLIIVEGELSAIRLASYGIKNVVGIRGNTLSSKQIALLYKYAFQLLFFVEEGEAANTGVYKSISKLIPGTMSIKIAQLERGDPDDSEKKVVLDLLENALTVNISKWTKLYNSKNV